MSDQALTSLAILTVNWDRKHDIVESFVPLIAECLRQSGDKPISALDLQKAVEAAFGLKIPIGALQGILERCKKRGYVRQAQGVYVPVKKALDNVDFGAARAEALRQHRCLLDKLRAFAKDRYQIEWSEEDADAALLGYLQENSLPVLAAATEGDPLPKPTKQSRRTKHVVSAFAGHLDEADSYGFTCLETVVKGHVLSTVLFYPDLGQVQTKFEDLDVYLDTPILLPAIGYSEEGLRVQCQEMLDLLRELGANLKCFHHTEEEVAGVLEAESARMRGNMQEPSEYSTSKLFTLAEVEEMLAKLPTVLNRLGIVIVDTPDWAEEPDEGALDDAIEGEIHYVRERAREKDVKSLAAVYRLRGGRRMVHFERAEAIFLTNNTTLARASGEFFRDIEGGGGVPLCMTSTLMTRLAWVKKPMGRPDLPRHLVIASSYAALNPSSALWREYLDEVERRRGSGEITDAEYHFLRSSREAREALVEKTLNDEQAFTAGTFDEILAHAKQQVQAEAFAVADDEREKKLTAQAERDEQRRLAEGIARVHREEVDRHARFAGNTVGWGVALVLGLAVIVGALSTVPGIPLLDVKSMGVRIVIWVCLGAFLAVTLYAVLVKHVSVKEMRSHVSLWVEERWRARGYRKLDELHHRASEAMSIRDSPIGR
jgi:hypothetical protein